MLKISSSNRHYPVVLYPHLLLKFLSEYAPSTEGVKGRQRKFLLPATNDTKSLRQRLLRLCPWQLGANPSRNGTFCLLSPDECLLTFKAIWATVALVIIMRLWLNPSWYAPLTALMLSIALVLAVRMRVHQWFRLQPTLPNRPVRPALAATKSKGRSLKSVLAGKVMPPTHQGQAPVGVAEGEFLVKLQQYFLVLTGQQFAIPNTFLCYTPDFLIVHPPTGLTIDVECDEPYEGKTLTPHHCLDDGKDARRDRFFLNGNIVVIRFAEEQIVRYPDACCQLVAQVIADLAGDTGALNRFSSACQLPPQPRWHRRQAKHMAKNHYRRQYLPWR